MLGKRVGNKNISINGKQIYKPLFKFLEFLILIFGYKK